MTSSTRSHHAGRPELGISYRALRHWILAGRLCTPKLPVDTIAFLLAPSTSSCLMPSPAPAGPASADNQLLGTVLEVTIEGLLAKVVLPVGTQRLTAIATADAPENSLLRPGDEAVALIKATEVMIGRL